MPVFATPFVAMLTFCVFCKFYKHLITLENMLDLYLCEKTTNGIRDIDILK